MGDCKVVTVWTLITMCAFFYKIIALGVWMYITFDSQNFWGFWPLSIIENSRDSRDCSISETGSVCILR
jgi:hypothetical protein